jgi:hypothetical protein
LNSAVDRTGGAGLVRVANAVPARGLEQLALSRIHSRGTRILGRVGVVRREDISGRDVA